MPERAARSTVAALPVRAAAGSVRLRVATDIDGRLPAVELAAADVWLTTHPCPPRPWVRADDVERTAAALLTAVEAWPCAAGVLLEVLAAAVHLPLEEALVVESLGYSTLLGGREFRAWLESRPRVTRGTVAEPVRVARASDSWTLHLADPARLNAYSGAMRDALAYALDSCLDDPTSAAVVLRGDGRAFCAGGALDEFGLATDLALAHATRLQQSAVCRLALLGARATAVVHGPVIGSGLEIAAAAARVVARPGAWFRLPELAMGLLPGAGGTWSVTRRIGRARATYLMVSGARLDLAEALEWGLVDAVAER